MRIALGAALAAASLAHVGGGPVLSLVGAQPLTVHGGGFAARRHVRLTFVSDAGIRTITLRTSRAGAFTVVLGAVPSGRCSSWTVRAVTAAGAAVLHAPQLPGCMP